MRAAGLALGDEGFVEIGAEGAVDGHGIGAHRDVQYLVGQLCAYGRGLGSRRDAAGPTAKPRARKPRAQPGAEAGAAASERKPTRPTTGGAGRHGAGKHMLAIGVTILKDEGVERAGPELVKMTM